MGTDPVEFRSVRSPDVLYACGECGHIVFPNTREQAERHCQCVTDGCPNRPRQHYLTCEECDQRRNEARARARADGLRRRPTVPYIDGPVYDPVHDRWYNNLDHFLDVCYDDDLDPLVQVLHPSTSGRASLPDLVTYVDEHIGEQYGDDSYDRPHPEVVRILTAAARELAQHMPVLYTPREHERIDIDEYLARRPA